MKNFDKHAAMLTAVIILALIGFIALNVIFPSVMAPLSGVLFVIAMSYSIYCLVKMYLMTKK